jgi:hypothetical protein
MDTPVVAVGPETLTTTTTDLSVRLLISIKVSFYLTVYTLGHVM